MSQSIDRKKSIKELEEKAAEIHLLKKENGLRRSILLEFCGTPKSGKTTAITALNIFLKRNGFSTEVLTERASVCPIPSKTHPFFNIWTACSAIAEISESLMRKHSPPDIIIADRGIFDALCWFRWLRDNPTTTTPYLDSVSYETLNKFLTMHIWTQSIDFIYVFRADPKEALRREFASLLTERPGSIMNEAVLSGFNSSIAHTVKEHQDIFRDIKQIDTTSLPPDSVSLQVTTQVLNALYSLVDEEIGYFNDPEMIELLSGKSTFDLLEGRQLHFGTRKKIEDSEFIQPIPVAIFTNRSKDRILTIRKKRSKTSRTSPERDRLLLWVGGHVRKEDSHQSSGLKATLENALARELQEELGESISFQTSTPFLVYDSSHPRSKKHLAVCYVVEIDFETKELKPSSRELELHSTEGPSWKVATILEIQNGKGEGMDSWSAKILEAEFGVKAGSAVSQTSMDFAD